MKNTAPHQNAHLHSKNPSPACGETGYPKGERRDDTPTPIPLGHRPLPILRREKTFLKTANNPSSRLREEVSRSDGGGQKRLSVLLGGPSNHTAWRGQRLPRLVRCQSQILHGKIPSPACGRRWPKAGRGIKNQDLSRLTNPATTPLGEPSNHVAWRAQQPRRLASPATAPLGEASVYPAWCVANLKFCTEKALPRLGGYGGRWP